MFISLGKYGLLKRHTHFWAIYVNQPLCFWKSSVKAVRYLHQFKQIRPVQQVNRKLKRSMKSAERKDVDTKLYMRDTIGKISKLLRYSTWECAKEELEKLCIRWDSYTINQVLKTHPPMEKAWLFFNWASQLKGFKHDQFTYTTMLDIFGEAKRMSSMNYIFSQMQEKGIKIDAVTYTSLLHWLSKYGDFERSVKIWNEMNDKGCKPTVVSYTAYIKVLFDNNRVKEAAEVYKKMLQSGLAPNCFTYTVLMEHLFSSGKYKQALDIFSKMQEAGVQPDKATCNILIEKCCESGTTWPMTQILQFMKENSMVLRYPIFLKALETFENANESDFLLRQVNPHIKNEIVKPFVTDRGLILNLLKQQKFAAIDHLLIEMIEKETQLDSSTVSTIVEVNCFHSKPKGALLAFDYSSKMQISIERPAYLALIGVLSRMGSFPKVVAIVEAMVKARITLGTYLGALLIYKLGRARKLFYATKIFNLLPDEEKNAAVYTALMSGHFYSGNANKGLKTYKTMREKGNSPTLGTYNVLLYGLEKCGKVHEVEIYRKEKSMQINESFYNVFSMEEKVCDFLFGGKM